MNGKPVLLAIETSGATCGVCLVRGGEFWGEYSIFEKHRHDTMLAELTQRLLNDAGISVRELDAVAVSAGPGSFTGLRVGAAFAKALCLRFDDIPAPKLIAVPTLDAYAFATSEVVNAVSAAAITAIVPSHRDLVYARRYSPALTPLSEILLLKTVGLSELVSHSDVVCGSGAMLSPAGIRLSGLNRPTPRFIGKLGFQLFIAEIFADPTGFTPMYAQEFTPKTGGLFRP